MYQPVMMTMDTHQHVMARWFVNVTTCMSHNGLLAASCFIISQSAADNVANIVYIIAQCKQMDAQWDVSYIIFIYIH